MGHEMLSSEVYFDRGIGAVPEAGNNWTRPHGRWSMASTSCFYFCVSSDVPCEAGPSRKLIYDIPGSQKVVHCRSGRRLPHPIQDPPDAREGHPTARSGTCSRISSTQCRLNPAWLEGVPSSRAGVLLDLDLPTSSWNGEGGLPPSPLKVPALSARAAAAMRTSRDLFECCPDVMFWAAIISSALSSLRPWPSSTLSETRNIGRWTTRGDTPGTMCECLASSVLSGSVGAAGGGASKDHRRESGLWQGYGNEARAARTCGNFSTRTEMPS